MISKEILSSAANAHRSAILTAALLALPWKWRHCTYCISSPNPGLGLDSLQQGGCQLLADWGPPCTVFSAFAGVTTCSAPSNLGSNVGSSMTPTRLVEPLSNLHTSPTATLHSILRHKLKAAIMTASCKWLLAVIWYDPCRAALFMMLSLPNIAATLQRALYRPLACSGSCLRATWLVHHSLIARALSVLTLWL